HDSKAVANIVFKTLDIKKDLVFSQGPLDALDHASPVDHYGYRLGVDATKKFPTEREDVAWDFTLAEPVALNTYLEKQENIVDYHYPMSGKFQGALIVAMKKENNESPKQLIESLWYHEDMKYNKFLIIVDEDVNPKDVSNVAWKVFNNIDADRDLLISEVLGEKHFGHRLGIDATKKMRDQQHKREWPNDIEMSEDIKELVSKRWSEYGLE
ncbi:MAG TPA: menaquinone biosynthesis decarboxylase, partial [Firmicutes bacterium]|nr:menaquinone biosynthesis decarboxylase [Bacillota bacterium]